MLCRDVASFVDWFEDSPLDFVDIHYKLVFPGTVFSDFSGSRFSPLVYFTIFKFMMFFQRRRQIALFVHKVTVLQSRFVDVYDTILLFQGYCNNVIGRILFQFWEQSLHSVV